MPDPINPISIVDGDTHINKYPGKKIYIDGNEYLPVGTVLMYNGSGIADAGSRSTPLGDEQGDTINMPDWYVCNGNAGTPNLLNKFVRAESASGNTDGSDDAIVVNHQHPGVGDHAHTIRNAYQNVTPWSKVMRAETYGGQLASTEAAGAHTHPAAGVSGVGANRPAYYSLIFIIRMA